MDTELIKQLFDDDLYLIETQSSQGSPQVEQLEEKEQAAFNTEMIQIFTDVVVNEEERAFLVKILSAIDINLDTQVEMHEWNEEAKLYTGRNFVFLTTLDECAITANRISAPSLNEVANNVDFKRSLWEKMQELYK